MLEAFAKEREGDVVDRQLLQRVIQCYVTMGNEKAQPMRGPNGYFWDGVKNLTFYATEFECHLLSKSSEEYSAKSARWISQCTAPEYLKLADQAFTHEEHYSQLLQPETMPKLLTRVEKEIIQSKRQLIIDKETGCKYMIENKRADELLLMYKCFEREESNLGLIIQCLQTHIESVGSQYVNDQTLAADSIKFT